MRRNSVISQKRSWRLAVLLAPTLLPGFSFLSCHKDSPSEPEVPRGVFVQKIAYANWKALPPVIAVADVYNDNGTFRLYNRKDLTEGGAVPSLARDESFLAFIYVKNGTHLRRINIDGSQLRDLISQENLSPQEVSISPNAKEIIVSNFQKDLPGMHLDIMPADGGPLTRIYSHQAVGFAPEWFPTGDKIIFTYADFDQRFPHRTPQGDRAKNYIVSTNKDGTDMQFISDTLSGLSNDLYPVISPDERKIAFVSLRNYPENIFPEVFLMTIDGTNVQQLTKCIGCVRHDDHFDMYTMDARPKWTNDGQYIYFDREIYTYNHDRRAYNREVKDIYIMKADGAGLQNITYDGISSLRK